MNPAPARTRWLLLAVLVLALGVRLVGLNFDQSHYYHPDERRIAEAVTQLSFRPLQLNPHFFAYGSFPFYVTKAVTSALAPISPWLSSYDGAVLAGRALSALWGAATVALLFVLGRRLYGDSVGLLAALLLAITVLHVQNSHFATTDVALTFLVLLALTAMVAAVEGGRLRAWAVAGGAVGLAVATKFSAVPLLLPLLVAAALRARAERRTRPAAIGVAVACLAAAAGFLVGEPYAVLDARGFLHDILEQSAMVRHAGTVPYTTQYVGVHKVLYDVREMVLWGMGPLLGVAAVVGTALRLRLRRLRRAPAAEAVLLAWALPFFAVTCSFDVKFLRYLLPIYPLLVLWAALALQRWAERSRAGRWARGVVTAGTAAYLLAFLSIYTRPHAAVTASAWFYDHAPPGAKVVIQDWDEGFPFALPGRSPERFRITAFGFYEADSPAKAARLARELAASDWLVLQTKRLYGAVSRAPAKYPLTDNFFRELFAGDLGYQLVKDVASRPSLLGVSLPTELADESFSVYDHPKAVMFRNTGHMSATALEARIANGLPSRPVSRSAMLLARAGCEPAGRADVEVRSSLLATLLCVLLLETLGLAAFGALRPFLPTRPGVYALAKVVGVLAFAYVPWLATSVGATTFGRPALWGTVFALVAAAWLAGRRGAAARPARAEVVASEAAFWGAFGLFLLFRCLNPEIFWGEKPMDFAFLNTLYRTATLPPPEPWFAGSPLMYTYFGHFTVAAIGKALGIAPAVMFNLGVATVAGLTAAALVAAGALLGRGWRVGAVSCAVVLLLGNLSGVREALARRAIDFDYFWATSRVVKDTINEYPFWSFTFADLHAHVLAMPWAVAFVALLALWLGRRAEPAGPRPRTAAALLLVLAALMLGAITVTNGWSTPTYVALLLALLLADWSVRAAGGGAPRALRASVPSVVLPAAAIAGGALLAFRPFWRHFSLPARQWGREVGPYARPGDVLTIFGQFLVVLVPLLFVTWRELMSPHGDRLAAPRRAAIVAVGAGLLLTVLDLRALAHLRIAQAVSVGPFAAAVAAFGAILALHPRTPARRRPALVLASFAMGLVAGCELVFVWDRMNTVFKFYLEAWLLLGLAASLALGELFLDRAWTGRWAALWRGAALAAVAVAAFTSASGAWGALTHRHAVGPRGTLDGMAYLRRASPEEFAAFDWLNRNVPGVPVLAEAYGPSYGAFSRVSMNTGLPIVLGWDYHVYQRGHPWGEINRRKADVETIFTSPSRERVAAALARYHVALVYVGPLERRTYAGANLANFRRWDDLLTPLYANPEVAIFSVNGAFVGAAPVLTVEEAPTEEPPAAPAAETAQDPPGVFRQPRGVAVGPGGVVYVADFGNCRVQELGADLAPVAAWGRRGSGQGELSDPCDVAVGTDGSVYVADTWNARIQVFGAKGAFVRAFGSDMYGPRGVAVDAAGVVFVTDTGNCRVCRYAPDGRLEKAWGGRGREPGKLDGPVGIGLDALGRVVVCDNGNARLQLFDREGALLRVIPVPGWRAEVFSEPFVAPAADGTLWVTVPLADEVRQYSADGAPLRSVAGGAVAPALQRPLGIAVSPDGRIVVSTLEGGIRRLDVGARVPPVGTPERPRTPRPPGGAR